MDKELIGKCYKMELPGKINYLKVIDRIDDELLSPYNFYKTEICINNDERKDVRINTCNIEEMDFVKHYYTEISHEEFVAAYDKALNIINEYRKQL